VAAARSALTASASPLSATSTPIAVAAVASAAATRAPPVLRRPVRLEHPHLWGANTRYVSRICDFRVMPVRGMRDYSFFMQLSRTADVPRRRKTIGSLSYEFCSQLRSRTFRTNLYATAACGISLTNPRLDHLLWRPARRSFRDDTVVHWHRSAFRRLWTWRSRRAPGRPPIDRRTRLLVRQVALANQRWGAPRIHGELLKLGIGISEREVSRLMPRAPRKPPSQTWRTFLTNHVGTLASIDFFSVPTATFRVL
jgi:hypothetical protein